MPKVHAQSGVAVGWLQQGLQLATSLTQACDVPAADVLSPTVPCCPGRLPPAHRNLCSK